MELILFVNFDRYGKNTFEIYSNIQPTDHRERSAVLKLDYNYTPWPRYRGNLLWQ